MTAVEEAGRKKECILTHLPSHVFNELSIVPSIFLFSSSCSSPAVTEWRLMTVYLQLTPPFLCCFPLSFTSPRTPTLISLRLQKHCFLASKMPVCLESLEQAREKLPFVCVFHERVCV